MVTTFAFIDIASPEMLVILVVAGLIFGGKKVSEVSRNLGGSIRDVKQEMQQISTDTIETRKDIVEQVGDLKNELKTAVNPTIEKTPPN